MAGESDDSLLRQWAKMLRFLILLFVLIFLLFGLICPHMDRPTNFAREVKQKAQYHSFEAAIELFNNEFEDFPPSDANDPTGKPYCGAMKLAEAMFGRDMLGFHKDSVFRVDRKDANGIELYDPTDLTVRKGPYLPPEYFDCLTLADIYGPGRTGPFDPNLRVLCDVFKRKYKGRELRVGTPILYYKADRSKTAHDVDNPDNPNNIYDYRDNHALLSLGAPGRPGKRHPLYTDPALFYKITRSDEVTIASRPFKAETYILLSAGEDGLYGTPDDICNFEFIFPHENRR